MKWSDKLRKLTDVNYLRSAAAYYPYKLLVMRKDIARLEQYHLHAKHDFEAERNDRTDKIVKYAFNNCPYYRNLFNSAKIDLSNLADDFSRVPLLDKGIIRNNYNNIVSTRINKMIYGKRCTGGSTGEPLEFYASADYDREHIAFVYRMMGYRHGEKILAMDGSPVGTELIKNGIYWVKKSDNDLPYGSMALSSLYLTDNTISTYIDYIQSFKPAIIRAYPSFAYELAKYIMDNGIEILTPIKGFVLSSEITNHEQINTISSAFHTKVFLQYGHTEASLFGYTIDDSYEYYCSPFYGYVEVLDDSGRHVKPGEVGEVVCTGFYNFAMPFIRYRTGDFAVFSGDRDGIVRLKSVLGRTQDYVYSLNYEKTLLTALVFGLHYKAFANIKKWQIVQDMPGEVQIFVVRDKSFGPKDEEEISSCFLTIAQITTKFVYVDHIEPTKRGKSKFIVQNLDISARQQVTPNPVTNDASKAALTTVK